MLTLHGASDVLLAGRCNDWWSRFAQEAAAELDLLNGGKVGAFVPESERVWVIASRMPHVQRVANIVPGNGKLNVTVSSILNGFQLDGIRKIQAIFGINDGIKNRTPVSSECNLCSFPHDPTVAFQIPVKCINLGEIVGA